MICRPFVLLSLSLAFLLLLVGSGTCENKAETSKPDKAWCWPWESGSSMYVCKENGKKNCINVNSGDACINLTGGKFVSGYSAGDHRCTIYSEVGCGGNHYSVDKAGWSRFPEEARSIKCPCV